MDTDPLLRQFSPVRLRPSRPTASDFLGAGRSFIQAAAPTLPEHLRDAIAELAYCAVAQRPVPPEAQALYADNLDWTWPELARHTNKRFGPLAYSLPEDPEARAAAELLIEEFSRRSTLRWGRGALPGLRAGIEAITGPPIPGHLHRLRELVELRIRAYASFRFSPTGPEFYKIVASFIRRGVRQSTFRSGAALQSEVVRQFERYFDRQHPEGRDLDRLLSAYLHASRAAADLGLRAKDPALLLAELERIRPASLKPAAPCSAAHAVRFLELREEALPPFDYLCNCSLLSWRSLGGSTRGARHANFVRDEADTAVRLWGLAWLVRGQGLPELPFELLIKAELH